MEYGRRLVVEWVNNVSTVIILLYRSEIFQFEIGAKRKTKVLRGVKVMNHATSELHDESAVTSVPETTRLQDLKALVKMGIVNSNTLTVFTGFLVGITL